MMTDLILDMLAIILRLIIAITLGGTLAVLIMLVGLRLLIVDLKRRVTRARSQPR